MWLNLPMGYQEKLGHHHNYLFRGCIFAKKYIYIYTHTHTHTHTRAHTLVLITLVENNNEKKASNQKSLK